MKQPQTETRLIKHRTPLVIVWLLTLTLAFGCLSTAQAAKILYVQQDNLRDTVKLINILRAQGHDVTIESAPLTAPEYAAQGYELLIVDEVIGSGSVGDKFRNSPIPVINWEGFLYNGNRSAFNADSDLSGGTYENAQAASDANGGAGGDFGQVANETQIDIVNPSHPLAAGLGAGVVDVFDPLASGDADGPGVITFAGTRTFISGVEVAARTPAFANGMCVFGVPAGVQNADGTTTQARWAHLPWNTSNDQRVLIEPSFFLFEAAVAWALELPQPTKISNLTPEGGGFLPADTEISFSVNKETASGSAVANPSGISLMLNGVETIGSATITDGGDTWDVSFVGLEANQQYTVVASATAEDGGFGARQTALDTFDVESALTFEAEDFNFDGGQFFDFNEIILCDTIGGGVPGCYFDRVGQTNIDKLEINFDLTVDGLPGSNEVYRFGAGFFEREEFVDTFITDDPLVRDEYVLAGLPEWEVRGVTDGEWMNYTRTIPSGNYRIYARMNATGPATAQLDMVDDRTSESPTLAKLGRFVKPSGTGGYALVPMTDDGGAAPLVVEFDGSAPTTLRLTALSDGFVMNFFLLAPTSDTGSQPPVVAITNPLDDDVLDEGVEVTITATAEDGDGTVTNVQFYAGTAEPLTLIGEDDAAPYEMPWAPPLLGGFNNYTIRAIATDDTGFTGVDDVDVEVIDPALVFLTPEADAQLSENDGVATGSNDPEMNTRFNDGTRNEVTALRFNLGGEDLTKLGNVRLTVVEYRDNGGRSVTLYGVEPDATPTAGASTVVDWDEMTVTFETMPGLEYDFDSTTRGIKEGEVTELGSASVQMGSKGALVVFDNAAIGNWINSYGGDAQGITFLLAQSPGTTSGGQFRMASKEADSLDGGSPSGAAGDFSPELSFKVLENLPPVVTITSPEEGATLEAGVEVSIAADVVEDAAVTTVQFYAGASEPLTLLGEDDTAPYDLAWVPGAVDAVTPYTVRVVANDTAGLSGSNSINVWVQSPSVVVVSTSVGAGADVEMVERNEPSAARNAVNLNTRWSNNNPPANRNEVVGLRFDLTGHTLTELNNVALNLVNYRDNSERTVDIYGVTQGAFGGTFVFNTETWEDTTVNAWGDLPGLLISDGTDETLSIDEANLTLLVDDFTITERTKGSVDTATSPELTSFVQNYSGSSLITFLITQGGGGSGGQFRFASKEATSLDGGSPSGNEGDFAPFLSFTIGAGEPPLLTYQVIDDGANLELSWTGSFKLQSQTNGLDIGITDDWSDYPNGGSSPVVVPIDPANSTVFFRLSE